MSQPISAALAGFAPRPPEPVLKRQRSGLDEGTPVPAPSIEELQARIATLEGLLGEVPKLRAENQALSDGQRHLQRQLQDALANVVTTEAQVRFLQAELAAAQHRESPAVVAGLDDYLSLPVLEESGDDLGLPDASAQEVNQYGPLPESDSERDSAVTSDDYGNGDEVESESSSSRSSSSSSSDASSSSSGSTKSLPRSPPAE